MLVVVRRCIRCCRPVPRRMNCTFSCSSVHMQARPNSMAGNTTMRLSKWWVSFHRNLNYCIPTLSTCQSSCYSRWHRDGYNTIHPESLLISSRRHLCKFGTEGVNNQGISIYSTDWSGTQLSSLFYICFIIINFDELKRHRFFFSFRPSSTCSSLLMQQKRAWKLKRAVIPVKSPNMCMCVR